MTKQTIEQEWLQEETLNRYTVEIKLKEESTEQGFLYLGKLLTEVRENKLYKVKYSTLKQYIESNFKFSYKHGLRFMQIYDLSINISRNVANFGVGKLVELLRIEDSEREDYIEANKEFLENASVREVKEKIGKDLSNNPYLSYFKRLQSWGKGIQRFHKTLEQVDISSFDRETKKSFRKTLGEMEIEIIELKRLFE